MSGRRGKGWSEAEIDHLCYAWLQVSEDASVGTGQKAEVFWIRVYDALALRLENAGLPDLGKQWQHAQSKFGAVSRDVSLFAAKYQQVLNLDESGKTVSDRLLDAQRLFQLASHTKPAKRVAFKYMSAYVILKDSPKWNTMHTRKKPSTVVSNIGVTEASSLSSTTDVDEGTMSTPITRPVGNKKAKAEQRQVQVLAQNAQVGEAIAANMKRKSEALASYFAQDAEQKIKAQKQKQELAEEKNSLKVVTLLLQTNPNSEIAKKLLNAHANAALKRLGYVNDVEEEVEQIEQIADKENTTPDKD